ncbi:DNA polymerase V [Hydrogenispora ethanolica]|uniref:DNA polymerase V n=1 Tax=Hydrogenispora ethanolica TaxID=1082276 RepID=A0A4R1S250_HYDET|nr:Y-family DNA polymerase [Hydrogenispora ethanolica]TCL72392.1 DNA polymerase V [Hydrogenispora ethanolica]
MFALADCNNFYVSCERVFNPALNGRPVVVLSNNDGCVIARSNEAKQLGIQMAQPAFQIAAFLKKNRVAVHSSNYALYGDMSRRVMTILGEFTPELEIYSIDEAFLGLAGLPVELEAYARAIRNRVLQYTGIPVSVGIGPTKVLAKLANHFAKKVPENQGVFVLTPENTAQCLQRFAVEEIWGIGRQYAKLLRSHGANTAWDLIRLSDGWVRRKMTVAGLRIKKELEGVSCLSLETAPPAKQAICTSRSFGTFQTEKAPIREAVATFAARCAFKLRRQRSCAGVLMVFIHTNEFNPNEPQYARNAVRRLPVATSSSLELVHYALDSFETIFRPGFRYKKAGVLVSEIVPEDRVQGSLFDTVEREKQRALMAALDRISLRFGPDAVQVAAQGVGDGDWQLRRAKLSPCYTTRWSDIITVKA